LPRPQWIGLSEPAQVRVGQACYPAIGVTYGIIGLLMVSMAVAYSPTTAVGLDAALATLAPRPTAPHCSSWPPVWPVSVSTASSTPGTAAARTGRVLVSTSGC
jgi:hypothetical protein